MIKSFKHKGLEKFFQSGSKAGIQPSHAKRLRLQLAVLNRATGTRDMAVAGWDLHPLAGGLSGHWSVSVNGNWRLTFCFAGVDVEVVDYQDYHWEVPMEMYDPAHPGEILREYMGQDMTVSALAKHLGVTRANLSMILNARTGISALMSLKLDEAFGTSPGLWLRLQNQYDLARARRIRRTKVKPINVRGLSKPKKAKAETSPLHRAA